MFTKFPIDEYFFTMEVFVFRVWTLSSVLKHRNFIAMNNYTQSFYRIL